MKLEVRRQELTELSTRGELLIDGVHECWTLEPVSRSDEVKPRAIPEGTYTVTRRFSPKHNRDVPHVEDVPGFEEIEIHPGNFPQDTVGCTLVGQTKGSQPDFIGSSKAAFNALWEKLVPVWERGEQMSVIYTNSAVTAKAAAAGNQGTA